MTPARRPPPVDTAHEPRWPRVEPPLDAAPPDAHTPPMTNPYAVPLDDLERDAHVPVDEQVTAQPEPPATGPLEPEELDRLRLLGVTGAGRLHPR